MALIKGLGRAAWWGGEKAANTAIRHPKALIGGAVAAGAAASLFHDAVSPEVQDAFLGSPTALQDTAGAWATGVIMNGFRAGDLDEMGTSNYLYGRPIQGMTMGNTAGSRVLGNSNLMSGASIKGTIPDKIYDTPYNPNGPNRKAIGRDYYPSVGRIQGSGRNPSIYGANGSMVFGMYNLR